MVMLMKEINYDNNIFNPDYCVYVGMCFNTRKDNALAE